MQASHESESRRVFEDYEHGHHVELNPRPGVRRANSMGWRPGDCLILGISGKGHVARSAGYQTGRLFLNIAHLPLFVNNANEQVIGTPLIGSAADKLTCPPGSR